jgi:hypothetical protein
MEAEKQEGGNVEDIRDGAQGSGETGGGASQVAEADVVAEEEEEEPPPTNEFESAAGAPDVFQDSVERSYRDDDPSMAEPPSVADPTESKEYYTTEYHQQYRQEPPVRHGVDELHSTGPPVDDDFPRRASYRSPLGSESSEREALPHEQREHPSSPDLSQPEKRPEFRQQQQQQQDPYPGWGIRQQQPQQQQQPDGSDQRHYSTGRDPSQVRQPSTGGPWGVSQSIDGTGHGRQTPPAQLPTQPREVKDQPTAQERGAPPVTRGQQSLGDGLPCLEQPHRPWGEQPAPADPRVTQQQLRQEPPPRYQEHHRQLTVQQQGAGQAGRAPLRQGGPGPTYVAQPPPISNEIQRGPPFVQPPPHAQRNAPPQQHLQPPGQGYRPQQAQTAIDPMPGTHGRIPSQGSGAPSYGQYGPYGTAPPGSYEGGPRQGIPPYGQQQSQGQFQQRPQLKQPPLPPPPNQLVETSTTAVKEALGRTWQGLLGLGNRTKEVVDTARTTVVASAIEASQTLSTTGSSTFLAGWSVKNCAFLDGPLESSNASFLFSCFQQACGIRQKVQ